MDSVTSECSLLNQLIDVLTTKRSPEQVTTQRLKDEIQLLKEFSIKYKMARDFTKTAKNQQFLDILMLLVKHRLQSIEWLSHAQPENILRVVVSLRILIRDTVCQQLFIDLNGLTVIADCFAWVLNDYHTQQSFIVIDIFREITNIVQKLCVATDNIEHLVCHSCHVYLVSILSVSDARLLHCALRTLVIMSRHEKARSMIGNVNCVVERLLCLLQDYDATSKELAAQMLRNILVLKEAKEMVKVFDGIPLLLSLLHGINVKLLWNIVWSLVYLSADSDACNDIRLMGGIPLLLSMLHDRRFDSLTTVNRRSEMVECVSELSLKAACCACLTELVVNDANGRQVVQNNGIYLLALLMLPSVHGHPSVLSLQAYALRALRFLFSVERNRRHFKHLFPAEFFEAFIDIGHYNRNIEVYTKLVNKLNSLSADFLDEVRNNIEACNQNCNPSRLVGDYAICEVLGSGAFGTVYKVRKKHGQSFLAMKEISTLNGLWGKTSRERQSSIGDVINELSIVREQLNHPNIVHYYKTFVTDDKLYIVMELIDGATLNEHFCSLKEKNEQFSEQRIWNIFTQLLLALRYLHKDKAIVHRDLTPNNVMLDENDKVTITDFGLAKQKQADSSKMNSVVGTILCSCPEIIQNLPYGEKADIWSLGCLLYQMCTLNPPFYSNNMLTLATKIVNAQYDPIPIARGFSQLISTTIQLCLTVSEVKRPDVIGLSAHVASMLLTQLDETCAEKTRVEKKLERERKRTQRYFCEVMNSASISVHQMSHNDQLNSSVNSTNSQVVDITDADLFQDTNEPDFLSDSDDMHTLKAVPKPPSEDTKCRSQQRNKPLSASSSSHSFQTVHSSDSTLTQTVESASMTVDSTFRHSLESDGVLPITGNSNSIPADVQRDSSKSVNLPVVSAQQYIVDAGQLPVTHTSTDKCQQQQQQLVRPQSLTLLSSHFCSLSPAPPVGTCQSPVVNRFHRALSAGQSRTGSACSSPATLSISPNLMRQISDPVLQLLEQVHHIIYITQLPPTLCYNPRRRVVDCFKRALFTSRTTAINLKNELHKLETGSRDVIDLNFGPLGATCKLVEQVSHQHENMAAKSTSGVEYNLHVISDEGITYEQMRTIIDDILTEVGYYNVQTNANTVRNTAKKLGKQQLDIQQGVK